MEIYPYRGVVVLSEKNRKWLIIAACGVAIGFLNGLFGMGGGMVAVPLLRYCSLEQRNANATSIAIILPLSVISAYLYLKAGELKISDSFVFLPSGLAGSFLGAYFLKRIDTGWLRRIFALLIMVAAVRLIRR